MHIHELQIGGYLRSIGHHILGCIQVGLGPQNVSRLSSQHSQVIKCGSILGI